MDHLFKLTAAAALAFSASQTSAFYAEPTMPPGTHRGGNGGWTFRPSAPVPSTGGRINGGSASINVGGGKTITRPVTWGIGPGAGRAIARGIVRGGLLGAGWGLAEWAAEQCVHLKNGGLYLKCGGGDDDPDKKPYLPAKRVFVRQASAWGPAKGGFGSTADACNSIGSWPKTTISAEAVGVGSDGLRVYKCVLMHADLGKQGEVIVREQYQCPEGATLFEPGKCSLDGENKDGEPLTEDQAVDLLSGKMPPTIPPGITIPVDNPVWNPSPGPNPRPRPIVTPIGDPVPMVSPQPAPSPLAPQPGADPQTQTQRITWTQPAVEITHSPTEEQPLRLEVRPIDVPVAGPGHRLKPETDGKPQPAPGGNQNGPDTGQDKPPTDTKPDDRPGLCEEYPDILACKELDEVDADEVPDMEVPISLEMAPGFARAGQCPADKTLTVMGKTITLSWRPICDLASGVRPVVIAFAALSAVAIVIGIARRDG